MLTLRKTLPICTSTFVQCFAIRIGTKPAATLNRSQMHKRVHYPLHLPLATRLALLRDKVVVRNEIFSSRLTLGEAKVEDVIGWLGLIRLLSHDPDCFSAPKEASHDI